MCFCMAETNSLWRMAVCSVQFHQDVNTAWNIWISIMSFTFVTTFISTKASLYSIGITSCLDGSKTRCYYVCNRRLVSVHCLYHTCYCVQHGVVCFGFHSWTIKLLRILHLQQMCYVPNKKAIIVVVTGHRKRQFWVAQKTNKLSFFFQVY